MLVDIPLMIIDSQKLPLHPGNDYKYIFISVHIGKHQASIDTNHKPSSS